MKEKGYRTLRGFLDGDEKDEEIFFAFSATLRIFGDISDLSEITRRLSLEPTHSHMIGDKKGPKSPPFKNAMWVI